MSSKSTENGSEPKYRDAAWLREQYVEQEQSTREIGETCGCSDDTIRRWLKRHGVERRGRGGSTANKQLADKEWIREQYIEKGNSTYEIAEKCGCHHSTVGKWIKRHGFETRGTGGEGTADRRLTDEGWLYKQYIERELTTYEIGDECECSAHTVARWLHKHGIETRGGNLGPVDERLKDEQWLREQYVNREQTQAEIAEKCDCSTQPVSKWLNEHEVETRSRTSHFNAEPADQRLANSEWLYEQYVEHQRTTLEIADECDCGKNTVCRWLGKHGISTRSQAADSRLTDREWLQEQYVESSQTMSDIAKECETTVTAVYNWLTNHGIETRDQGYLSGKDHPCWDGGEMPYGPGWNKPKKRAVRERDDYTCQDPNCTVTQAEHRGKYDEKLHVHHLQKARDVDDPEERNDPENLITFCQDCHKRWEKVADAGLVPEIVR